MSRKLPSLAALLGLVAIAGYQNREKIGEFVKGLTGGSGGQAAETKGGLGELVDQFKKGGLGDVVESWIGKGPNTPVNEAQVEKGLGGDLIDSLAKQTGLTREELLARLSKVLPEAVDTMTPDGKI